MLRFTDFNFRDYTYAIVSLFLHGSHILLLHSSVKTHLSRSDSAVWCPLFVRIRSRIRCLDHLRQNAPYIINLVAHIAPVLVSAAPISGLSLSILALVISAYRHRHARNIMPARFSSITVCVSILPRIINAVSSSGVFCPNRVSKSRMIPQNSNLIMWHVARWSMFSVSLHAVHELHSAFVSFPTVYNVRCQTLVHCSLSRAVTKGVAHANEQCEESFEECRI